MTKAQDGSLEILEPYDPARYARERAEGAKGAAASSSSAAAAASQSPSAVGTGGADGGPDKVTEEDYDSLMARAPNNTASPSKSCAPCVRSFDELFFAPSLSKRGVP